MYRVCFVCTGNICRSPMAESVFRARVAEAGLDALVEVDSAGTGGWFEGDGADPRTVTVLESAGYEQSHRARQFRASWFSGLDLVIALDAGHLRDLRALAPTPRTPPRYGCCGRTTRRPRPRRPTYRIPTTAPSTGSSCAWSSSRRRVRACWTP